MYTHLEVLNFMQNLPLAEQLLIVEKTLRGIRQNVPVTKASITSIQEEKSTKHPLLKLAGTWTEEEADEFEKILKEGDKIDYDGW